MSINQPAAELPVRTCQCQVRSIDVLSSDISRVILGLPEGEPIKWYAGQYLMLAAPEPAAFSIANASGGATLELHIRHADDNPTSRTIMQFLEQHGRDGASVQVELPMGNRYLHGLPTAPLWIICGSTGYAPANAMLEDLANQGFTGEIRLYWGARTLPDLYLLEAAQTLTARLPGLRLLPALSEEIREGFYPGLVHELALADLGSAATAPLFYVGGSPAMGWAVFDALVDAGVSPARIHSDVFDYAPRDAD